jgi:hypothetical protein
MVGHRTKFSFSGRPVIVGVANYPLAFWQSSPKRLIKNLLKGVQQFSTLIQEQTAVCSFDGQQTTGI